MTTRQLIEEKPMKTMFFRNAKGALIIWLAISGALLPVHAQPFPHPNFVEVQKSQNQVEQEVTAVWDRFIQTAAEGNAAKAKSFIRANNLIEGTMKIMTPDFLKSMASSHIGIKLESFTKGFIAECTVVYRRPDGKFGSYPMMFVHTDVGWLIENF